MKTFKLIHDIQLKYNNNKKYDSIKLFIDSSKWDTSNKLDFEKLLIIPSTIKVISIAIVY